MYKVWWSFQTSASILIALKVDQEIKASVYDLDLEEIATSLY